MKIALLGAAALVASALLLPAAPVSATAALTGFLQNGVISNTAVSANIVAVTYSLGPAGDGIATWESNTDGGTAADFLSDPTFFQTITWSGLSVAPGNTFTFGGLDIDLINTLVPLDVTGATIGGGPSLAGAFLRVTFDDNQVLTRALQQQSWDIDQQLDLRDDGAVPEPSSLALLGCGILALPLIRRRR